MHLVVVIKWFSWNDTSMKIEICILSRGNCGLRKTILSLNDINVHLVETRRRFSWNDEDMNYKKNHEWILKFEYCRGENAVQKQTPDGSEKQVHRLRNTNVHLVGTRCTIFMKWCKWKCKKNHEICILSRQERGSRAQMWDFVT